MNLKHCDLCEHKVTSLEIGLTCKLTKKKPNFQNTCATIKLDEKFQEKLEIAILELNRILKNKKSSYLAFFFYMIIGCFSIILSYTLIPWDTNSRILLESKIVVIGLGVSILSGSNYKLYKFRQKLNNAKDKKNNIDVVLEKYNIRYTSDLDFEEKIHGNQQINVTLEFKNWIRKSTTTSHIIDY